MSTVLTVDNRDAAEMENYHIARIDALKDRVKQLEALVDELMREREAE